MTPDNYLLRKLMLPQLKLLKLKKYQIKPFIIIVRKIQLGKFAESVRQNHIPSMTEELFPFEIPSFTPKT